MDTYITILEKINNDRSYKVNKEILPELIQFMLKNIGNVNPYIRDTLIYSGFSRLILEDNIPTDQQIAILKTCIHDDYLYCHIHNTAKDDFVFVRSFSALVIDLILFNDLEQRKIPDSLLIETLEKSGRYLQYETDYRGYVESKGWAHSVAHGADLLTRVVLHPLSKTIISNEACLQIIEKCLTTDYAFIDEEDERFLPVIDALLERGLSEEVFCSWMENLYTSQVSDEHKNYRIHWNKKKFTHTLYFHLIRSNIYEKTSKWILTNYILN